MLRPGLAALVMFGASGACALAADLDLPPLSTESPPLLTPRWEGFNVGAFASALWAPSQSGSQFWWPAPWIQWDAPGSFNLNSMGAGAGVQVGYDKQYGDYVVGGIVDYGILAGTKASQSFNGNFVSQYLNFPAGSYSSNFSQTLNGLGTIRSKFGYVVYPDWLVYGTAGLAFGQTTISNNVSLPGGNTVSGSRNGMSVGYVYGAGVQYAVGPNWSLGAEALAYDLGSKDSVSIANFNTYANIPGVGTVKLPESIQTVNKTEFKGFELRLTASYEFDGQVHEPTYEPSADPNSEVPITVGIRSGLSMGQSQLTLYDGSGSVQLSRLTYKGASALTAEPYFKMEIPDWNMYVSGFVGIGKQSGGTLKDEDFPPDTSPYSSTNSSMADGSLTYGAIDVGYNALSTDWYKVGGFVGYTFQNDNYYAFGCTQTASNSDVCGANSGISGSNLTISDSFSWNAARLGISGSVKMPYGFTFSGNAAWLPVISFSDTNYHYLRMPGDFTGPLPGTGSGATGFQLEGMFDYALGPNIDIGIGARYWSLAAKGHINFQNVSADGTSQVADFNSQRLQAFLQTGYHF
jgi:opacity protein-like surface antigen